MLALCSLPAALSSCSRGGAGPSQAVSVTCDLPARKSVAPRPVHEIAFWPFGQEEQTSRIDVELGAAMEALQRS